MKKAIFVGLMIMSLIVSTVKAQQAGPEKIRLTVGSTTSTSGAYVWSTAVSNVINNHAPGIFITQVEALSTYDNIKKIRDGIFDWTSADAWAGGFEMYRGLETFKGKRWEPIRWFFLRELTVSRTYVRADSGIKTWSNLAGKRLAPGIPSSAAAVRAMTCNEVLGTGAKIVHATLADEISNFQTGRIDAVHKGGPWNGFDASMVEVHLSTPLTAIGFSDDEVAKLSAKYPQFLLRKTPAGAIKLLPKLDSIWEMYSIAGAHTSSRLPEDVGYRIIKAVYEHWDEVCVAYPSSKSFNPIGDYLKVVPRGMELFLHAGVVRYAKEIGLDVPAAFIPPEYRGK